MPKTHTDLCRHNTKEKFRVQHMADDGTNVLTDLCFACLWALREASAQLMGADVEEKPEFFYKGDDDVGPSTGTPRRRRASGGGRQTD